MDVFSDPPSLAREQNALFKLGTLLQKDRSPIKTAAVNAVLRARLSAEEKVSTIHKIDMMSDEEVEDAHPQLKRKRKPAKSPPPGTPAEGGSTDAMPSENPRQIGIEAGGDKSKPVPGFRNTSGIKTARRQRLTYFAEPQPGGIIAWFFGTQKRIREFGEATQTIQRNSLPFTLKPHPHAFDWFRTHIQGILAQEIEQLTQALLRKSWLYLDKKSYNSIAILSDLVLAIRKVQPKGSDKAALKALSAGYLGQFLHLAVNDDLRNTIGAAIDEACSRLAIPWEQRKRAMDSYQQLFSRAGDACTLANIIRAAWMLGSHRYLELGHLVPVLQAPIPVPDDAFDCSFDVQKEIDTFFDKKAKELEKLYSEYLATRLYHYFLPLDASDPSRPSLIDLHAFTSMGPDTEGFNNPARYMLNFNHHFIRHFNDLINNQARLADGSLLVIFPKGLIHAQLSRMMLLAERMGKLSTIHPEFTSHRHHKISHDRRGAEPAELEMSDILREYSNLLVQFGSNMADIIRTRGTLAPPWTRASAETSVDNPIPHEESTIAHPPGLKGLVVHHAISRACSLSWACAIHLGDLEPEHKWKRFGSVIAEARDMLQELTRLGTSQQVEDIISRFPFTPVDKLD